MDMAAQLYLEHGSADKGGDILIKAAKYTVYFPTELTKLPLLLLNYVKGHGTSKH